MDHITFHQSSHNYILEEQFSNDCLKTVTKAITLINHNRCKHHDELIRTGSNVTCSKHKKKSCVQGAIGFGFAAHWLKKLMQDVKANN